ncbi:MAG: RsmB/NOP family class I SAM-dependent RNA methyltransferase, partial [Thermoproteota archaeon]
MASESTADVEAERLAQEAWRYIEEERGRKPKLAVDSRTLRILVEVIKAAEELKPSQHAKRAVLARHGVIGTGVDRLVTSVFYDVMKRMGILDRVAAEVAGVPTTLILDPWLRAALRVAVDVILFHRPSRSTLRHLRWGVADFLSAVTHPYVGMYYWQLFDKLLAYRPKPRRAEELLELKYSMPAWLIRRARSLLGDSEAEELLRAFNSRPPISVRVNTLKATVEEVVEELRREGKEPRVSERVPTVVKFEGPYDFDRSRIYREGKIVVQEEAAAAAAVLLAPEPGETVVDLCAAPGGKTTHLAELMRNRGRIYAFDVDRRRLKRMRMLLRRTGTENIVRIFEADARRAPRILGENVADRVLLDAPCTSTGTIAKNPELRWRVREEGLAEITKLQRQLLEAAVRLAKPGGRILYTVCSILPEEGEEVVKWALEDLPVKLVPLNKPYDPSPALPGT